MIEDNKNVSFEDIREAFNPFTLHAGPRMLMYMYIDGEYYERKRHEYAFSRIMNHSGTIQSLYDGYVESGQAEQDIQPLQTFHCWVCGRTGGSMIMISASHFLCQDCQDNLAKLFPKERN